MDQSEIDQEIAAIRTELTKALESASPDEWQEAVEKTIRRIDAIEERRLTEELAKADKDRSALQSELNHPTASRSYDAQVNLVNETKAAERKAQGIVASLRKVRARYAS